MIDLPKLESRHRSEKKPKTHPLTIGALAALEEKFNLANGLETLKSESAAHLTFVVWHARVMDGDDVGDYEEWRGGCLYVRDAEVPETEGPTEAGD